MNPQCSSTPNPFSFDFNCQVVEDYSSKLGGHPNLKWEVIDGSHRKMVQFKSANDPGYRQVGGALKGYMNSLTEEHDAERECKLLRQQITSD